MKTPFVPHHLPIQSLDWQKLIPLVGLANSSLSAYNGILHHMINPLILTAPLRIHEAVLSSKIEGTQASLTDVLNTDLSAYDDRKKGDIEEVMNCINALEYGTNDLKNRPLCLNMIRDIHNILMRGVRGDGKARGEFRKIQNYIGSYGTTMEQARFIPPSPEVMLSALHEWEKYIHNENEEMLIQLAVVHAQFEIIHPFLDGNGRIGRILIPLFLYSKKYLEYPVFYLSEFLESHRGEYYDRLLNITEKQDWQGWIEFFLNAIIKQSDVNKEKARNILALHDEIKAIMPTIMKSSHAINVADLLFVKPVLTCNDILERTHIHNRVTANSILSKLVEAKILVKTEESSGRRPAIYTFERLIRVAEGTLKII